MLYNKVFQRAVSVLLVTAFTVCTYIAPASAADAVSTPTCDETYYATLDYYGNLKDSSVVKSYQTYGTTQITDYGNYDAVNNLTDSKTAEVSDGKLTYNLKGSSTDRFCFEGKTAQPYNEFPWKLSVSYKLNGVPTSADKLAGKCGVVEITLDAFPNAAASDYAKTNLVLTASALFNGDEILSLEANGAQEQLIGNMRCVLFAVLPGEEQHFTISVGTNDFSFGGMFFLAVPATLSQLEQVAKLKDAKDTAEDSYDAINDSLDVLLNSLDGMSDDLNRTANGLDQLNSVRQIFADGKVTVYDSLDAALEATGPFTDSLEPMSEHIASLSDELTDLTDLFGDMTDNINTLKPTLDSLRTIIATLKKDNDELRKIKDELKDCPEDASKFLEDMIDNLAEITDEAGELEDALRVLRQTLARLSGISELEEITVEGMTVEQIRGYVAQAQNAHTQYLGYLSATGYTSAQLPFATFLVSGAGLDATSAALLANLYEKSLEDGFDEQLEKADSFNEMVPMINAKIAEINRMLSLIISPTVGLLDSLEDITGYLNSYGVGDQLVGLLAIVKNVCDTLEEHKGLTDDALNTLDTVCDVSDKVITAAETAIEQVNSLNGIVNKYNPEIKSALTDGQTLTKSMSDCLSALVDAAKTAEALAKKSSDGLNNGTYNTLSGLSAVLRHSTVGLGQTDTLRNAKNTLQNLIDDQWNTHIGEKDNLLLMDANASPVSMTDSRNEGTNSIQFIMRTEEIKVTEEKSEAQNGTAQEETTFWGRVAAMFVDIWNFLTGWIK